MGHAARAAYSRQHLTNAGFRKSEFVDYVAHARAVANQSDCFRLALELRSLGAPKRHAQTGQAFTGSVLASNVPRRLLGIAANLTGALAAMIENGSLVRPRMSGGAGKRILPIFAHRMTGHPPSNILTVRDGFNVSGIYATWVPAKMVANQSLRDRGDQFFINVPVRAMRFAAGLIPSIAVDSVARPKPTALLGDQHAATPRISIKPLGKALRTHAAFAISRRADAAAASSSSVANFASANACQMSPGMRLRWIHDRAVWIETAFASANAARSGTSLTIWA